MQSDDRSLSPSLIRLYPALLGCHLFFGTGSDRNEGSSLTRLSPGCGTSASTGVSGLACVSPADPDAHRAVPLHWGSYGSSPRSST